MNQSENTNLEYDYIIVGTGPAGAVMAKTLSDNLENSVLVLEAGDNNTNEIPIKDSSAETWMYSPQYFWQGRTVPQVYAYDKTFSWTTGRTLGGGSSVNGEQYARPTMNVLSQWENLLGPMWSPFQAIHYFTQLENYNGLTDNPEFRGYDGPIDIRQAPEKVPMLTRKFITALEQATGFPIILDYNDPNTPLGPFFRWQLYQQPDGQRESAATAFLSPDIMTPDGFGVNGRRLRVLLKSTALRIIFNNNEAIGVEYLREGNCENAYARKKVIICAGINSSQLLMLSGIGPVDMLKAAGIPIIFNNPNVGNNLLNQVLNTATFTVNSDDLPELSSDPNSLYYGGAFLPYPNNSDYRGVQIIGMVSNGQLSVLIISLLPESRGSITIQNDDPLKIVLANYNYFENPYDIEVIKSIFKTYIIQLADHLHSIDPAYQLISPSIEIINDDIRLEDFIRRNVGFNYHEQSFNRMAPLQQGGVVDEYGNVYGVNNLIVADTSIIPFTIDSNNSATSYLIGYTIANYLLRAYGIPTSYF